MSQTYLHRRKSSEKERLSIKLIDFVRNNALLQSKMMPGPTVIRFYHSTYYLTNSIDEAYLHYQHVSMSRVNATRIGKPSYEFLFHASQSVGSYQLHDKET